MNSLLLRSSLAHFPSRVMSLQFICAAGKRVWRSEPHRSGSEASCVIRCYDCELEPEPLCTYPKGCSEEPTCHVATGHYSSGHYKSSAIFHYYYCRHCLKTFSSKGNLSGQLKTTAGKDVRWSNPACLVTYPALN